MSDFWKRMINVNRNLIGSVVYFCPNKSRSLKCIVRDDGTISAATKPNQRFGKITDLIDAWKTGFITDEDGKALSSWTKTNRLSFPGDFFFQPNRCGTVKNNFRHERSDTILPQAIKKPVTNECPGFYRRSHQDVLINRKWETERKEFSPVAIEGDRLRSKKCDGRNDTKGFICHPCKLARQRLWETRRFLKRETTERSRILHTPNRYLTENEKSTKRNYRVDDLKWKLRMARTNLFRARMEMAKYRPIEMENQKAVRSVVKKVNDEQRKLQYPICQWTIGDKEICGYRATTICALISHVREAHWKEQLAENKDKSVFEQRIYQCNWRRCSRQAPFKKFQHFRRHMIQHTGSGKTSLNLEILREQMINISRQASGRRYRSRTMQLILHQWRSRRAHEKAQTLTSMPFPSVRTVLAHKNFGGIKPGIDWTILAEMEKIGKEDPMVRDGFLSFDEVRALFVYLFTSPVWVKYSPF